MYMLSKYTTLGFCSNCRFFAPLYSTSISICSATSLKESNRPSHWKDQITFWCHRALPNKWEAITWDMLPHFGRGNLFSYLKSVALKKKTSTLSPSTKYPPANKTNSQNERNPASPRQGAEEGEGNYTPLMCGIRFKATFPRPKNSQFNGSVPKNKQLNHFKQGDSWQSSKVITHFIGPS